MLDFKVWIIIALVLLSFYQYNSPEKSHDMLDPLWGKAAEFTSGWNNPLKKNETKSDGPICPDNDNPVCGSDGVTYTNICFAMAADVFEVTPGECESG